MACFFACNVYIFLFSSRSLTLLSDEFVQKKGVHKIICTSKYILEDTNMENERKIKILELFGRDTIQSVLQFVQTAANSVQNAG